MKKILFTGILCVLMAAGLKAQEGPPKALDSLFTVKETFRYEVKYGFFKLGWVDVMLLPDTLYNGKMHKHLFTKITSNPKIPFVGTEEDHFHSFFYEDENGYPVTTKYWKDNMDEGLLEEIVYTFDREAGKVYYQEEDNTRDTLDLVEPATAGHVIFLFSRLYAGTDVNSRLPVFVTKKGGFVNMKNPPKLEKRDYAAFDEPVNAYLSTGTTEDIEGPFGFSGDFRAWFLDDDLRVPLEARVKVFLGNAIIRLIEYKKEEL